MPDITLRQMVPDDLDQADLIYRLAFGTFLGHPDPPHFAGDSGIVSFRYHMKPEAAFVAESEGRVVGSVFCADWGSQVCFGPLTVHPEFWDQGVASRLMEPVLDYSFRNGERHMVIYTHAHSPKHIGLYLKYGLYARFLTPVMSREAPTGGPPCSATLFSSLSPDQKEEALAACAGLSDAVCPGLDFSTEIRALDSQGRGETLLVRDGSRLAGMALCHTGPGSEGGSGMCRIKFGLAGPGPNAGQDFSRLLDEVLAWAGEQGIPRVMGGVNMAREEAYRGMLAGGFRTDLQGVAMHRPNEPGFDQAGNYLILDCR